MAVALIFDFLSVPLFELVLLPVISSFPVCLFNNVDDYDYVKVICFDVPTFAGLIMLLGVYVLFRLAFAAVRAVSAAFLMLLGVAGIFAS